MTHMQPMRSTDAFAELGRIRFSETDLDVVLAKVADLAKRTIPGADEVSVTLAGAGGGHTAAFTSELALILDEWQYQHGHGPCLAAAVANITVTVADMAGETRWPQWVRRAIDARIHSCLSVGLPLQQSVSGALNVYATTPNAFDEDAIILAESFGGYGAVAMANAHQYDPTATLTDRLQAAMDSRALIEQAKGIVMAQRRCTADDAFASLATVSQNTNRTVGDVAAALVTRVASAATR